MDQLEHLLVVVGSLVNHLTSEDYPILHHNHQKLNYSNLELTTQHYHKFISHQLMAMHLEVHHSSPNYYYYYYQYQHYHHLTNYYYFITFLRQHHDLADEDASLKVTTSAII